MKTVIQSFAISFVICLLLSNSQNLAVAHPIGPRAKNHKPGVIIRPGYSITLPAPTPLNVKGARAKNYRNSKGYYRSFRKVVNVASPIQRVTGPAAKNRKRQKN